MIKNVVKVVTILMMVGALLGAFDVAILGSSSVSATAPATYGVFSSIGVIPGVAAQNNGGQCPTYPICQ